MTPVRSVEELKPLTSLRFAAACMIVVLHTSGVFKWGWNPLTSLGHGVSFFFVLSGFILTHVYTTKPIESYGRFLRSRFARLWPVHVVAIALLALTVPMGAVTFSGSGLFDKWVVLAFNLSLLHAAFPFYAYTFSWNSVSWSISTELYFYLAFPFLVQGIRQNWHWRLLGAISAAVAFLIGLAAIHVPLVGGIEDFTVASATYANPVMRACEFCLGMASWVLWDRVIRPLKMSRLVWSAIEITVITFAICWLGTWYQDWFLSRWPPSVSQLWKASIASCWLFAIIIIAMASGRGILGLLLSLRLPVFLGEISFSIYMLHQVLIKIFIVSLGIDNPSKAVYFGTLLVLASSSFLLIEKPAQRMLVGKKTPLPAEHVASHSTLIGKN